jgi:hypothetical protein
MLSALSHGGKPEHTKVLDAFAVALESLDEDRAAFYSDIVLNMLPDAARKILETHVTMTMKRRQFTSDFYRRIVGDAEALGEARGEALTIVRILEKRFKVSDEVRRTISECTDRLLLDLWADQCLYVHTAEEMLELEPFRGLDEK